MCTFSLLNYVLRIVFARNIRNFGKNIEISLIFIRGKSKCEAVRVKYCGVDVMSKRRELNSLQVGIFGFVVACV